MAKAGVYLEVIGVDKTQAAFKGATRGLDKVGGEAEKTQGRVKGSFGRIGGVIGGLGLAKLGKDAIVAGSDLAESLSKVEGVFGESAGTIEAWSKTTTDAFGIAQADALEAAGTLGNLFTSLKLPQQEASKMSRKMVELSGDLASFNNVKPEEALDALRAGLVGETEPLKRFGVNMNAATLKAQAMEMGLVKNVKNLSAIRVANIGVAAATDRLKKAVEKHGAESIEAQKAEASLINANERLKKSMAGQTVELTAAQKAQAAYGLIMEQTTNAQGDAAKTGDMTAGTQRRLAARAKDLSAQIGTGLMPAWNALLSGITFMTDHLGVFLPILGAVAAGFATYKIATAAAAAINAVFGTSLTLAAGPIAGIVAALVLVGIVVFKFRKQIWGALKAVGRFFVTVFGGIKTVVVGIKNFFVTAFNGITNFFSTWGRRWFAIASAPYRLIWDAAKWLIGKVKLGFTNMKDRVVGIFTGIRDKVLGIWNAFGSGIRSGVNLIIGFFNTMLVGVERIIKGIIGLYNKIPGLPNISVNWSIPKIPKLDDGGHVLETGLAVVHKGEDYSGVGSSRRWSPGGGDVYVTIVMNGPVTTDSAMEDFAEKIRDKLVRLQRRNVTTGLV